MAFPVAGSGTTPPIYPTGSTGNGLKAAGFIPEIWSGKLIEKFYSATVLAAIANTDYEGEIKAMDLGERARRGDERREGVADFGELDALARPLFRRHGLDPASDR